MINTLHKNINVYSLNVYSHKKKISEHYIMWQQCHFHLFYHVSVTDTKKGNTQRLDIPSGTMVTHGFTKMFPMPEKLCVDKKKTETYWHY